MWWLSYQHAFKTSFFKKKKKIKMWFKCKFMKKVQDSIFHIWFEKFYADVSWLVRSVEFDIKSRQYLMINQHPTMWETANTLKISESGYFYTIEKKYYIFPLNILFLKSQNWQWKVDSLHNQYNIRHVTLVVKQKLL